MAVVNSAAKQICVIAGPGSGKTKTLLAKVRRYIEDGTPPGRVYVCTFTVAAAKELRERLGGHIKLGHLGTLHSLALRILNHAETAGKTTVLDEEQADAMLEAVAKEMRYGGTKAALAEAVARYRPSQPFSGWSPTQAELVAMGFNLRLRRGGLATYDTLLWRAAVVAGGFPGVGCLLIDEHQDSSADDCALYAAIRKDVLFAVGDPDQGIYGFRKSSVEHINNMAGDLDTSLFLLESNYRSCLAVCDAANRLIARNRRRVPKTIRPVSSETGRVSAGSCEDERAEEAEVHARIAGLLDGGVPPEEIAVLVRTNALADKWQKALSARRIPVARASRAELPADWKKAESLLQYMDEPANNTAAGFFIERERGRAAAERLRLDCAVAGKTLDEMSFNLAGRLEAAGDGREAVIGEILGRALTPASCDRIARARAELEPGHAMADVLLALREPDSRPAADGPGICVSTLHGAKGREWEAVLMAGFNDEVCPSRRKAGVDMEEERRLAYVGITRAKSYLHISWPRAALNPFARKNEPAAASRFVAELEIPQQKKE